MIPQLGFLIAVLTFPICAFCVFMGQADRSAIATWGSCFFSIGLNLGFLTPLWCHKTRVEALRKASLTYLGVSCGIHLTWELGWLVLRSILIDLEESPLGYPWWIYIDAGDRRYLNSPSTLVTMECLSVCNGLLLLVALFARLRLGKENLTILVVFWSSSTVHVYSTALYFLSEIFEGLPNCDFSNYFNIFFAFFLANIPWLYMPFVTVYPWIFGELKRHIAL